MWLHSHPVCGLIQMPMVLAIRSLYQAQPKLNFETLSRLPTTYARRKAELMQPMDMESFRYFMHDQFDCDDDVADKVDAVFKAFDTQNRGCVACAWQKASGETITRPPGRVVCGVKQRRLMWKRKANS